MCSQMGAKSKHASFLMAASCKLERHQHQTAADACCVGAVPEHSCHGPPPPPHLHCRVPAEAASEDCSKVQLQLEHIQAVAAARLEGQQALADAQRAWAERQAAAEKQHLQALLRCKQAQEQDRLQWQRERDELVQQLTAQYTASGLQVRGLLAALQLTVFCCCCCYNVCCLVSRDSFGELMEGVQCAHLLVLNLACCCCCCCRCTWRQGSSFESCSTRWSSCSGNETSCCCSSRPVPQHHLTGSGLPTASGTACNSPTATRQRMGHGTTQ